MRLVKKEKKITILVCPHCEEEMRGESSSTLAFSCKCGLWKLDWNTKEFIKEPDLPDLLK